MEYLKGYHIANNSLGSQASTESELPNTFTDLTNENAHCS